MATASPRTMAIADSAFACASIVLAGILFLEFYSSRLPYVLGFNLSYLVLPFFILAIFLLVYTHSWTLIRQAWGNRRLKWSSWLGGVGFAVFYLFATNMVSTPDAGSPPPHHGYLVASAVYSQMALWPDVEFWEPKLKLFGYFSVGSVLLLVSLGLLTSFALGLLMQSVSLRAEGKSPGTIASFGGAMVTSLFTNSCCCCAPLLLPLVSALAGATAAASLQFSLFSPGTPSSDMASLADLALLLVSILISTRRNATCAK